MRVLSLFLITLGCLIQFPLHAHAEAPVENHIRVGVLAYSPPWYDGAFVDETLRYLSWKLPKFRFEVQYYSPDELSRKINSRSVDMIASPASFYMLFVTEGLYSLAALASDTAKSPNRAAAATLIVRSDRTDLQTLKDLRGKHISTVAQELSPGLHEVWAELGSITSNPTTFFGSIDYEAPLNMQRVVDRVLSGEVDAGILRACFIEDQWNAGSRNSSQSLRVINLQDGSDGLTCLHSTKAYPGWLFAATDNLTEDQARLITATLLTKPSNAWGQHWSMATKYSGISQMHQLLMLGPYAFLKDWTWKRFLQTYWPVLLAVALVIAVMLVHGVVLRILVHRRTRDLERAHKEQELAQRLARETSEKLDALQRLGAVGQISAIVAHEIKQPLATIQNLSQGVVRILEDDDNVDESLTRAVYGIEDQAKRAAQIIDRVRSYSQGKSNREYLDLSDNVVRIVEQFKTSGKGRAAEISVKARKNVPVKMIPIDLELIVLNLLSNAAEAVQHTINPKINVSVTVRDKQFAVISVVDNGPLLSQDEMQSLGNDILKSTKPHGLGLGVMIIKTLTEGYVGSLRYERNKPHGVCATVSIPLLTNRAANTQAQGSNT